MGAQVCLRDDMGENLGRLINLFISVRTTFLLEASEARKTALWRSIQLFPKHRTRNMDSQFLDDFLTELLQVICNAMAFGVYK